MLLHPLVLMRDDAPTLSNEISHSMASECVRIIQDYNQVREKLNEMLAEYNLSPFRENYQDLNEYLTPFLPELKMTLEKMLVNIRGGKMSIDRLKSLLNRINNKKSNPKLLNRILVNK